MSLPNQYLGSGAHESAVLKQTIRDVRTARPDLYKPHKRTDTSMDGEGRVTANDYLDVKARAITPARRHALAYQKHGF